MNKIEMQQENIKKLLELVTENPELEIIPMVDTDCVQSDDFSSWMAEWSKACIDEYWSSDERIYFKSEDYDRLVEDIEDKGNISEDEAKTKVNNYSWEKAIIVRIVPM